MLRINRVVLERDDRANAMARPLKRPDLPFVFQLGRTTIRKFTAFVTRAVPVVFQLATVLHWEIPDDKPERVEFGLASNQKTLARNVFEMVEEVRGGE